MSELRNAIQELDVVALLRDSPVDGLVAGQTGTVVFVHGQGEAFEVEFILKPRESVVVTLKPDDLLKLRGLTAA